METRKVQFTGGSTYTISLPKEWAREHDIDPGTSLAVVDAGDGTLVVGADGTATPTDVGVDVDSLSPDAVARVVRAAATCCDGETSLAGVDDAGRRAVRRATGDLVGVEVVGEREDEVTVANLLDAGDVSLEQTVVQLQYVALSTHRDAVEALLANDAGRAANVTARLADADRQFRLVDHCVERTLASVTDHHRLGVTRPTLFDYYVAASALREFTAAAVSVAETVSHCDAPPATDDLRDPAHRTREAVEGTVSALLNDGDVATAAEYFGALSAVREAFDPYAVDDTAAALAVSALDTAAGAATPIAERALRSSLRAE